MSTCLDTTCAALLALKSSLDSTDAASVLPVCPRMSKSSKWLIAAADKSHKSQMGVAEPNRYTLVCSPHSHRRRANEPTSTPDASTRRTRHDAKWPSLAFPAGSRPSQVQVAPVMPPAQPVTAYGCMAAWLHRRWPLDPDSQLDARLGICSLLARCYMLYAISKPVACANPPAV